MDTSTKIAQILLDVGAIKVSIDPPFTWTSGIKSPIYCDNRMLISHPEARSMIVEAFEEALENLGWNFDFIAGTATAAIPWAAFLSEALELPMVYVRSKPKGHGAGKQVEGDVQLLEGKKALIVEDLISTGGSALNSAEALKNEMNADVAGVISIFTYDLPSTDDEFVSAGLQKYSLCEIATLLELTNFSGEDVDRIMQFAKDPENWFDNL